MRNTFFLFLLYGTFSVWAQVKTFLSTEIENDFINFRGKGTDHYYTGGNRLMLWRENDQALIRSYGMSVSQQAFTPSDLQQTDPAQLDYPYAGLLFCSAHLLVMAPEKKWRFYNTLSIGTTGAKSGVADWQRTVHRIIGDEAPRGWHLSLPVSYMFQVETAFVFPIIFYKDWHIEFIHKWEGGNFFNRFNNGLLCYWNSLPANFSLLFHHPNGQFKSQKSVIPAFYFMTQHTQVLRNRLLEESLFRENPLVGSNAQANCIREGLLIIGGGVGFSKGRFGCYVTQQWQSSETMLSTSHSFGAIRFAFQLSRVN